MITQCIYNEIESCTELGTIEENIDLFQFNIIDSDLTSHMTLAVTPAPIITSDPFTVIDEVATCPTNGTYTIESEEFNYFSSNLTLLEAYVNLNETI